MNSRDQTYSSLLFTLRRIEIPSQQGTMVQTGTSARVSMNKALRVRKRPILPTFTWSVGVSAIRGCKEKGKCAPTFGCVQMAVEFVLRQQ